MGWNLRLNCPNGEVSSWRQSRTRSRACNEIERNLFNFLALSFTLLVRLGCPRRDTMSLEVRSVCKEYRAGRVLTGVEALAGVDLVVETGELVAMSISQNQ